ncbi:MAG: hypothetical protein Ct9H300mP28_27590 [Pseudomonadota bacterium]|nr:MAG: hypothetical protein Ct9H300mP28_27590 [Pseudomonadota bacterium]
MILGETVTGITWLCMIVSAVGLGVMVGEEVSLGKGLGEFFACAPL